MRLLCSILRINPRSQSGLHGQKFFIRNHRELREKNRVKALPSIGREQKRRICSENSYYLKRYYII